ncbi:MAG: acyltransferase family protein [Burkholderiales bacterium]|nr:acyltransferase family protein [Burkholderiales bacterium]
MSPSLNLWSSAARAAAQTPASRNRYVDFLRALSILVVISGHWLVAAPYVVDGEITLNSMLAYQEWTQILSWLLQVMPVFFFVGGYSNSVSWQAARRDHKPYAEWLIGRLQRLAAPVLPLLVVWALLGIGLHLAEVRPGIVTVGSRMSLIPIWFLAVYIGVTVITPLSFAAWRRFGMVSFWLLAVLAALNDVLFFIYDLRITNWFNYAFVWLAVHQLGYAWRDGRLSTDWKALLWSVSALAFLIVLVTLGPYPFSMVSVPGTEVSNSSPPKLAMLLLGLVQIGLLLSLETPGRRWLQRPWPWTATVLVNSMIMTIYLWHRTASVIVIGVAIQFGNVGLTLEPGSGVWWLARVPWLAAYFIALTAFALVLGRFERSAVRRPPASAWRQVAGAVLICGGLSFLALKGIGSDAWLGVRWWGVLLPFAGALLAGVNLLSRSKHAQT